MKKLYLPLFWKFSIAITIIVIVFGSVNILLIYSNIDEKLYNESINRVNFISSTFFRQSEHFIKEKDFESLEKHVDYTKNSDTSIAYAIIYLDNQKRIISSTDDDSFLIAGPGQFSDHKTITFLRSHYNENEDIINVSARIYSNPEVYARLGVYEVKHYLRTAELIVPSLLMVLVFLAFGILGAFIFARFITRPIKEIIQIADKLEFDTLNSKSGLLDKLKKKLLNKFLPRISVKDELDILVSKFYKMVERVDIASKEKEQSYSKLMQAEKLASIGTLTAGIAHEINNPIAGIKNCVRRIKINPENHDQNKEYLDLMASAINKTEEVVRRLLDYSRTPDIIFGKVDINEVIEKSILLISYKFEKYHISIINKIPHSLPQLTGNFNQLEQVFVNMFMNSIDAIESRTLIDDDFPLLIELLGYVKENRIHIEITDHGIGIEENKLETVFDPFYTTKEIGKGTGLGLFVCYNIIQSHKGTIKAESKYLKGTKFILEFPLK